MLTAFHNLFIHAGASSVQKYWNEANPSKLPGVQFVEDLELFSVFHEPNGSTNGTMSEAYFPHTNRSMASVFYEHGLGHAGIASIASVMAFLSFFAVIGNCLVVVAVISKSYLQTPTGYVIVSMAVADLIVGVIVMPLAIMVEINGHVWPLGLVLCDIFHCLDILACTASIWNLSVISVDRYLAIHNPLRYWDFMTTCRTLIGICAVWIGCVLISFPAIAWWRRVEPELYENPQLCLFPTNPTYVLTASVIAYYIPLMITLGAYSQVFLIAYRHEKSMIAGHISAAVSGNSESVHMRVHRGGNSDNRLTVTNSNRCTSFATSQRSRRVDAMNGDDDSVFEDENEDKICAIEDSCKRTPHSRLFALRSLSEDNHRKQSTLSGPTEITSLLTNEGACSPVLKNHSSKRSAVNRIVAQSTRREKPRRIFTRFTQEKRAAKTLAIVVGCFVICWLPFFVANIVVTLCPECLLNEHTILTVITWLGYLNSALNPLIYGLFNRQFSRAFKEILHGKRAKRKKTIALQAMIANTVALANVHTPGNVEIRPNDTAL